MITSRYFEKRLLLVLFSCLFCYHTTFAVTESIISRWDQQLNNHSIAIDSFIETNLEELAALNDFSKFEILFYMNEIEGFISENSVFPYNQIGRIKNEHLQYVLTVFEKISRKLSITRQEAQEVIRIGQMRFSTHIDGIINLILSNIHYQQGDIGKALDFSDRAINRAKLGGYRNLFGAAYHFKSHIYFSENLTERAYATGQKGLFYAKRYNAGLWEVMFQKLLGEIQFNIQNVWMAKDHWEEALIMAENRVHELIYATLANKLAKAYLVTQNHNVAAELISDALIVFYRHKQNKDIAETHFLNGQILFALGDFLLAERNMKLSLSYIEEDQDLIGEIYAALAALTLKRGKAAEALSYAQNAMKAIELNSQEFIALYKLKAEIYYSMNNLQQSNAFYQEYIRAKDSLKKDELQQRIAELNSLFRSEQRERKILEQQQILDEQENEIMLSFQQLENEQLRNRQLFFLFAFILVLFGLLIGWGYYRNKQMKLQQQHKSSELRQTLLRSQMNPHFIFNSFSIIQSYIYDNDKEASSKFLVNFSRLIRLILENSSKEMIKLSDEVEILKRYLFVQKIRFEDRFQYEFLMDIELENEIDYISIPPMIAQPFIENAIEHGELQKVKQGKISVSLEKIDDLIQFTIIDNGIGYKEGQKRKKKTHQSMAIEIARERIALLNTKYNCSGMIEIIDRSTMGDRGTRVTIRAPYFYLQRDQSPEFKNKGDL
jgi:tetratricopeptide (TPR) repeat protein